MEIPSIEFLKDNLSKMTDKELEDLVDELYANYSDERKCLDEQMIVNRQMYSNHYIYEARALEAKAKFLYAKAEVMMRNGKGRIG